MMRDIVPIKLYEYRAMGKTVITTKLPGVMKEFGEGDGVIYVDKPEGALWRVVELIDGGVIPKIHWDDVVDDFEGILEELT